MRPAPQRSICDLLVEERAQGFGPGNARPVFVFGAEAGALLGANAAGCAAWGLDPATATPPIALDGAMPALRRLRDIAVALAPGTGTQETLTFWTARGLLSLSCRITASEEPSDAVRVEALRVPPATAAAQTTGALATQGGSCQADRRALELDVARDAWLAHELRTPLSAVIAYAEILKTEHFGPLANARYKSYAGDIYNSARHALSVVDSLLNDERARTALPTLAFADLDPASVVEGCLTVARPLADQAGLVLGAEFAARLPRIVADELSLRQMLLNLLANAIKFARRGDRVTVVVAYAADGPLTISVADTGPGMNEAPKADRTSLGLGLPLTRALAAANGATVAIDSAPARGTCVSIAFGKDRVVPV